MLLRKYNAHTTSMNFNWKNTSYNSVRIKKFFLKLNVIPVRGSLLIISFNFFENNDTFFQNFLKNKNFLNINCFLQRWLILKRNKICF